MITAVFEILKSLYQESFSGGGGAVAAPAR